MSYGIPPRAQRGRHMETMIGALMLQWENSNKGIDLNWTNPLGLRTVLGYPVPDWQRPLVWSQNQMVKFIESIWYGYDLGSYSYCEPQYDSKTDRGTPNSFILVDGQQRLNSIQKYWEDEFPVFGLYWSELSRTEQRRFLGEKFTSYTMYFDNDEQLRAAYNRMNFGGTVHTEDQRA